MTAAERAQKTLDAAQREVDKTEPKVTKAEQKYANARAAADSAKVGLDEARAAHQAAVRDRDHAATHPALPGNAPAEPVDPETSPI